MVEVPHRLYHVRLVASRALARAVTHSNATLPVIRLRKAADARAQSPPREVDLPVRMLQVLTQQGFRRDTVVPDTALDRGRRIARDTSSFTRLSSATYGARTSTPDPNSAALHSSVISCRRTRTNILTRARSVV